VRSVTERPLPARAGRLIADCVGQLRVGSRRSNRPTTDSRGGLQGVPHPPIMTCRSSKDWHGRRTFPDGLRCRVLRRPDRRAGAGGGGHRPLRPSRRHHVRDPGRAHAGAGPRRPAGRPRRGLRAAARRAGRPGAADVPARRHPHRRQLRRGEPAGRGAAAAPAGRRGRATAAAHRRGAWRRHPGRVGPGRDAGVGRRRRAGRGHGGAGRGQCLSWGTAHRRCAAGRGADRGDGPGRRPGAGAGAAGGAFRLGMGRLGPPGRRHPGRAPAGMRVAGDGRLLRRSRL